MGWFIEATNQILCPSECVGEGVASNSQGCLFIPSKHSHLIRGLFIEVVGQERTGWDSWVDSLQFGVGDSSPTECHWICAIFTLAGCTWNWVILGGCCTHYQSGMWSYKPGHEHGCCHCGQHYVALLCAFFKLLKYIVSSLFNLVRLLQIRVLQKFHFTCKRDNRDIPNISL